MCHLESREQTMENLLEMVHRVITDNPYTHKVVNNIPNPLGNGSAVHLGQMGEGGARSALAYAPLIARP